MKRETKNGYWLQAEQSCTNEINTREMYGNTMCFQTNDLKSIKKLSHTNALFPNLSTSSYFHRFSRCPCQHTMPTCKPGQQLNTGLGQMASYTSQCSVDLSSASRLLLSFSCRVRSRSSPECWCKSHQIPRLDSCWLLTIVGYPWVLNRCSLRSFTKFFTFSLACSSWDGSCSCSTACRRS